MESRSDFIYLSLFNGKCWSTYYHSSRSNCEQDGGLRCNENGEIEKPFPEKPYCYTGESTFTCKNNAAAGVAVCQTVLPGNEAMLIPTYVNVDDDEISLAVPGTEYWAETAAQ
jgi:hypothetical protein